ncbi:FAD-dependent oxidoreductase [Verrucomicrobium spinosum]|uniref:FAD-dependent oxidoreductase n=1 Tax=Verrucomicrobium spinosum TaxID=2736 RepID=UPI000AEE1287|nr:FAD-dependent oxidoreductase [Verrucomicrobium spinosum]
MKLLPLLFLAVAVPGTVFPTLQAAPTMEADVIVYGATPGGFCAAIGAARKVPR